MFELKNKVALVTGGASGIGLAYAKELLRRKLKAVALVDINEENGVQAVKDITAEFRSDDCVIFVKADVTDDKQLEDAIETTIQKYQQFDILINNAGVVHEMQWRKCIDVNLNAVIHGSKLAMEKYFPKYKSSSESLIINTASIEGLNHSENFPVYASTKAAVIGLTRSMGGPTRYKITKTRIIAVCPGLVHTNIIHMTKDQLPEPYLSNILHNIASCTGQKPQELAENVINIIPDAPTGSVWLSLPKRCTMIEFPSFTE